MKRLKSELEGLNLKQVRPLPYPGTYAVISPLSMMAEGALLRGKKPNTYL